MRVVRPACREAYAPPPRPQDAPQEIHRTVGLCPPCHRHIHTVLDNKELERDYNTVEALRTHPDVEKFIAWIGKKPHGTTADSRRGFR